MKKDKFYPSIIPNPPVNGKVSPSTKQEGSQQQLELFPGLTPALLNRQKPQITSVPGTSPKDPYRYCVKVGDRIIASHIDSDTAWEIAANCAGVGEVDA